MVLNPIKLIFKVYLPSESEDISKTPLSSVLVPFRKVSESVSKRVTLTKETGFCCSSMILPVKVNPCEKPNTLNAISTAEIRGFNLIDIIVSCVAQYINSFLNAITVKPHLTLIFF